METEPKMKRLTRDSLLLTGLVGLLLGQLLYFVQFTTLYVLALVFVLAVAVPYPRIMSSWISRALAALLLAFSAIQVAGVLQFFVFPKSGFTVLSLLITGLVIVACYCLRGRAKERTVPIGNRRDMAALFAALFFILPFCLLCFWKGNSAYILDFAGMQSPDGASHFTAIAEMASTQHLDYRTVQYYPKGFHLASAFIMQGLHANQALLSWTWNTRVYIASYIVWGSILTYFVICLAIRFTEALMPRKRIPFLLVGATVGPVLAVLYLFPFAFEGFINYYYVSAAAILGALFLYDYVYGKKNDDWWLVAYLLLVFGITLSWGPLLAPALLLVPLLYVWHYKPDAKAILERYGKRYWGVLLAFIAQLVPVYLHLTYAKLNSQQGLNATGGITNFDFGVVLLGLGLTAYFLHDQKKEKTLQAFASCFLISFYVLIGFLMFIQYMATGELRYYAIKTSYLLEIIVLAMSAASTVYLVTRSGLGIMHQWLSAIVCISLGFVLLVGITADPFALTRIMFAPLRHPIHRAMNPDIQAFSLLGQRGELDSTNTSDLHFDSQTGYLYGNELIPNWANIMQHTTDSTASAGLCSGRIFSELEYTVPSAAQQAGLVTDVNDCVGLAQLRHRPYFIVTDKTSLPHLKALFGNRVKYMT